MTISLNVYRQSRKGMNVQVRPNFQSYPVSLTAGLMSRVIQKGGPGIIAWNWCFCSLQVSSSVCKLPPLCGAQQLLPLLLIRGVPPFILPSLNNTWEEFVPVIILPNSICHLKSHEGMHDLEFSKYHGDMHSVTRICIFGSHLQFDWDP